MKNLLNETMDCVFKSGHKIEDIVFIGSEESGHSCNWKKFAMLANTNYDNGFGGQEVAKDLIIVFSDGNKMWRGEYDGSEWWEYSTPFKLPNNTVAIKSIIGGMWATLEELHE